MLEMPLHDHNIDNDTGKIYRLVEVKLEHIADNLLCSKNNNDDNVLYDIHQTIEKNVASLSVEIDWTWHATSQLRSETRLLVPW